ncbi:hypothetical protein [Streptomyces chrestomyceticus]|uniref:hypothetical protein n=1 Tax=Streptomyces chrestomyceticus TaxID=68185 RepID=UPI0033F92721
MTPTQELTRILTAAGHEVEAEAGTGAITARLAGCGCTVWLSEQGGFGWWARRHEPSATGPQTLYLSETADADADTAAVAAAVMEHANQHGDQAAGQQGDQRRKRADANRAFARVVGRLGELFRPAATVVYSCSCGVEAEVTGPKRYRRRMVAAVRNHQCAVWD